jgi:hypothetical protein
LLILTEDFALLEQGINEAGLTMVNMGDNRYIPDIITITSSQNIPLFTTIYYLDTVFIVIHEGESV